MKPCDHESLRQTACRLVELGAVIAEQHRGGLQARRKPDDSPVTSADLAAQRAMVERVIAECPHWAVLLEEEWTPPPPLPPIEGSAGCWVIDPIDGTRNFLRGSPCWAVSAAAMIEGRPVAGAIRDASRKITFSAALGGGAFQDDRPLRTCGDEPGPDATVMLSSFRRRPLPAAVADWMQHYQFRNLGSLCLHQVWVAAGSADAAFAVECKLWDIAAGSLIVTEAGGLASDPLGRPLWPLNPANYQGEDIPILIGGAAMHHRLLASGPQT